MLAAFTPTYVHYYRSLLDPLPLACSYTHTHTHTYAHPICRLFADPDFEPEIAGSQTNCPTRRKASSVQCWCQMPSAPHRWLPALSPDKLRCNKVRWVSLVYACAGGLFTGVPRKTLLGYRDPVYRSANAHDFGCACGNNEIARRGETQPHKSVSHVSRSRHGVSWGSTGIIPPLSLLSHSFLLSSRDACDMCRHGISTVSEPAVTFASLTKSHHRTVSHCRLT